MKTERDRFLLLETSLVGVRHHISEEQFRALPEGAQLTLKREPENKFDPHAIAVHAPDGTKIGFVTKAQAGWLSRLIDNGLEMYGVLQSKSGPVASGESMSAS